MAPTPSNPVPQNNPPAAVPSTAGANTAGRRMIVEMKAFGDADTGIKVEPIPGEKFQFLGTLIGPSETPYEGGTFVVHIIIPEE